MLRALRFLLVLGQRHAGLIGTHTKARALYFALLAVFGTAAFVFAVILATLALRQSIGLLPALAAMTGLFLVGCLVVLLVMQREQRRHDAAVAAQKQEERRMLQAALLAALPALRRSGVLAAFAGAFALVYLSGRGRGRDGRA